MGNSRPGLAVSYHIYVVVNNHISKLQLFRTCIYMMNKLIIIIVIIIKKTYVLFECFAVLYCMAYDIKVDNVLYVLDSL